MCSGPQRGSYPSPVKHMFGNSPLVIILFSAEKCRRERTPFSLPHSGLVGPLLSREHLRGLAQVGWCACPFHSGLWLPWPLELAPQEKGQKVSYCSVPSCPFLPQTLECLKSGHVVQCHLWLRRQRCSLNQVSPVRRAAIRLRAVVWVPRFVSCPLLQA